MDVIEMTPYKEYTLSDDLKIFCSPFRHDSWICYKSNDKTIVNINDCEFSTQEELMDVVSRVGKVDLLLTQLSFAGSPGNEQAARNKREKLKLQANVLKPDYLIPFASFVWFCHEENYYMNEAINKIQPMYEYIKKETTSQPIILYPGEKWTLFEEHDSIHSIEQYNVDYRKIEENPDLIKTVTVSLEELKNTFTSFTSQLKKKNNLFLVKLLMIKEPTSIYITDYKKAFRVSVLDNRFEECDTDYNEYDVALTSDALHFCLKYPWGWDTLNINGRFQTPANGIIGGFKSIGNIQMRNSHGEYFTALYLLNKVKARFTRKLKRFSRT